MKALYFIALSLLIVCKNQGKMDLEAAKKQLLILWKLQWKSKE
jgi:hypothetical protein